MTFRLFGYDVEITLSFLLSAVMLGYFWYPNDPKQILIVVPVTLVGVLVHELGHALAFSRYKVSSSIRLHFMGGVTMPNMILPLSRPANVLISFAGPLAGFILGAICVAIGIFFAPTHEGFKDAIWLSAQVNILWSIFNLVPVLPLDGGHILEHILGPRRYRWTLGISGVVGAGLAVLCAVYLNSIFATFILATAAFQSFMRLRDVQSAVRASGEAIRERREAGHDAVHPDLERELRQARRALDEEDFDTAEALAQAIADGKSTSGVKATGAALGEALTILGWAEIGLGRPGRAADACERLVKAKAPGDAALFAAVALHKGETQKARSLLEAARAAGDPRKEVFGPLIRILLEQGETARAAAVALDSFDGLSEDDARTVAKLAMDAGSDTWSGRLYEAVFERGRSAEDGFEAARAFARGGDPERALSLLRSAVGAGFQDADRAYGDDALGKLALDNILRRPS
jgi:Zn-dependent protease